MTKAELHVWYADEVDSPEELGWYYGYTPAGSDPLTVHDNERGPFATMEAAHAAGEAAIAAEPKACSICGRDYTGWGNNAQPINSGRCCDDCNELVVARRLSDIARWRHQQRGE